MRLDGDDSNDLADVNSGSAIVSIMLNSGDGAFNPDVFDTTCLICAGWAGDSCLSWMDTTGEVKEKQNDQRRHRPGNQADCLLPASRSAVVVLGFHG